jgi:biopolymer transport protein TolQ
MNNDLSIVTLMNHATPVVKAVVLILILMMISSWAISWKILRRINRQVKMNADFDLNFRSKRRTLGDLYEQAMKKDEKNKCGKERVFVAGEHKYQELKDEVTSVDAQLDGSRCAMHIRVQRELEKMESGLWLLGTVGSVSPYVGLLGTVWGIMHAFTGLGGLEQVTLAKVAPGIAEALVATAIALLTAIPAVIAYNRFVNQIDQIANHLDIFIEEYVSALKCKLNWQGHAGGDKWLR